MLYIKISGLNLMQFDAIGCELDDSRMMFGMHWMIVGMNWMQFGVHWITPDEGRAIVLANQQPILTLEVERSNYLTTGQLRRNVVP